MLPGDVFQFTLFWDSMEKNFNDSKFSRHDFQPGDVAIVIESSVFNIVKNHNQHLIFMCNGKYHQIEFFTPESDKLEILMQRTKKLNNDDKL